MNAAGFSDANANRISITAAALLGLTAFVTPLAGNKGANLERIASTVECHFDPFDDSQVIPPRRDVLVPFAIGSGPLSFAKGAVAMCCALMVVPQAATNVVLRLAPFQYQVRVVLGVTAVATTVYFAGAAAFYSTLVVAAGSGFGERMMGALCLVLVAAVAFFPGAALLKLESLYLAFRMFDRGAASYERAAVRLYVLVDVAVSCLLGVVAGGRLRLSKAERELRDEWRGVGGEVPETVFPVDRTTCSINAAAAVLVCVGYVGYIAVLQPLADRVQLVFVLVLALMQLAVAVGALLAIHFPWALQILGLAAILQLITVAVMLTVVLGARAVRQARVEALRRAEFFEEEKSAAEELAERPLLRLPDDSDEEERLIRERETAEAAAKDAKDAAQRERDAALDALQYEGLSLFEEERRVNERYFGPPPSELARRKAQDAAAPEVSAAERRRRRLEELRALDTAERAEVERELSPVDLRILRQEERAVRALEAYDSHGFGRTARELEGELLAQWVQREGGDAWSVAALIAAKTGGEPIAAANAAMSMYDPELPPAAQPALLGHAVRTLEAELAERRATSRNARATLILGARRELSTIWRRADAASSPGQGSGDDFFDDDPGEADAAAETGHLGAQPPPGGQPDALLPPPPPPPPTHLGDWRGRRNPLERRDASRSRSDRSPATPTSSSGDSQDEYVDRVAVRDLIAGAQPRDDFRWY